MLPRKIAIFQGEMEKDFPWMHSSKMYEAKWKVYIFGVRLNYTYVKWKYL